MDKKALRSSVRVRLRALQNEDKILYSTMITKSLESHLAVCGARVVALFSPLPDEPQLWPLVDELSKKAVLVVLPRVEGDSMSFYGYNASTMSLGSYGIMEPDDAIPVSPGEIDAMVVPGVAFTESGLRLGRGKGFYDKYMSHPDFRALKLGVCYPVQIVGEVPHEPHDKTMDVVIYM